MLKTPLNEQELAYIITDEIRTLNSHIKQAKEKGLRVDTVLSFKTIPIILVILRKTIIFAHSDA